MITADRNVIKLIIVVVGCKLKMAVTRQHTNNT